MHVELHPRFASQPQAAHAGELIGACVHCGFCLEACPTYRDGRDERDSPRGRIYLIKDMLESGRAQPATQRHLDRCLTCRACETACPSGVQYGELLDIGRGLTDTDVPRTPQARAQRRLLRALFRRPRLVAIGLALARRLRPFLPASLAGRVPAAHAPGAVPTPRHARRMLLLEGCVQRAATPATNAAARRVLDRLGISLIAAPKAGCCGALDHHLGAQHDALIALRRNIDAWWPYVEDGAEAIISSASGCGAMIRDYGRLLADDPAYAERARRIAALARDLAQVVAAEPLTALRAHIDPVQRIAVHTPCTLRHALGEPALLSDLLHRAGCTLTASAANPQCCGSAGTYSLLQPQISARLAERALEQLGAGAPDLIVTANIGCQLQLAAAGDVPVRHWIELLDSADGRHAPAAASHLL